MTTSALDHPRTNGENDDPRTADTAIGAGRAFTWLLVVCGALGSLASWVITVDKFKLLEDPNFVPACSLNPIISCGNIMKSAQAGVFGFPNPMMGMIAYPMVLLLGVGLLAGARYRAWFWLGLQAGTLFGVGFVTWLQYQSLYEINSLCLWCCLAWAVTIALFWYTLVHNVKHRVIPAPPGVRNAVLEFHWVVPVLWYGVIIMLILIRWWTQYWSTLI